ncbi:hypothetical protein [Agriterribacter sp.]|nr:hypothetical protein [Agriterribacter sp.]HRQ17308.1 hypothetical protein [Agriterribacter sp.]
MNQGAKPYSRPGYALYPDAYRGAVSIRQPFGYRTRKALTIIPAPEAI